MAMAQWLAGELDKPADAQPSQASGEYRVPGAADDVVQVFHLTHAATTQDFQQEADQIRTAQGIRLAFTYSAQRALTLRGTVSQLALAQNMIQELEARSR
jgi:hypothetical protein